MRNVNYLAMENRRLVWIDLLNVFSCISVVILHTSNHAVHWWDGVINAEYLWGLFTHTLFICAVPLFFMISGTTLLDRDFTIIEFYKKRFARIGVPFIFWSLFYWRLWHSDVDIKEFFRLLFAGQFNPVMWFMIPLIGIYLSIPFLRIMLKNCTKSMVEAYLILSFLIVSLFPLVFGCFQISFISNIFPLAGQYLYVPVLGYYLSHYRIELSKCKIGVILVCTAIVHISCIFLRNNIEGRSNLLMLDYNTPTIVIMSSCWFILFKTINTSTIPVRLSNMANVLASCSFGVYLIHYIFVYYIEQNNFPVQHNVYCEFVYVYACSVVITYVFKHIPYIKRCV